MEEPKRTRKQQAEQTKRQIFNAAMHLLDIKDFDSITVRDIVNEAKVSIGSFYNSYHSKLEVFYDTYRFADEYFDLEVRPNLTQKKVSDQVLAFFEEYARYSCEYNPFALTRVRYNPDNVNFHRHSEIGMLPTLREVMDRGISRGEFQTDLSAEDLAQFFMVCIRGVVYDWCIASGSYDLKEKVRKYVKQLLLGITDMSD